MSQQINEMLNSDTIRGSTDQKTTFLFQPTEIRPPSRDGLFLGTQMASSEDVKIHESNDNKTSVSLKLEVCDSIEDEGSSSSRPPQCLSKESDTFYDSNVKSCVDNISEDVDRKSNSSDEKRDNKSDIGVEINLRGESNADVENEPYMPIETEEFTPVEQTTTEKRKRRPRGRKSANASLHVRNDGADSSGDLDFDSPLAGTPSLKSMFPTEKRKRGRPRGSRGSRGANSSFESKTLNESSGSLTDFGSGEIIGDISGSNVLPYETTPPVIKIGRGALRPGCKSYRGRAASMGRGYKVEYSESPSWETGTGMMPVEYDSALSPLTDIEMSGRRQYPADPGTSPLPKRARGTRKRGRGRSRGRLRASLDRSIDSDSSDFGISRFETPDYSTRGCDTPELVDPNTESEVDVAESVEKSVHRRRRGKGSRGGRISTEVDLDVSQEAIVTCAVCKETMTQQLYSYHKLRKHNNCAWREGIDTPLDLNEPKVLNPLLKVALQRKKQLTCEQCGLSRSSLVGFQSHITFCAKTEGERDALMETCPVCKRRMMPSSLKVHMGVHRQEEKAKQMEKTQGTPEHEIDPGEGSSKNSGKSKRAAANRAVSLMQQFIKGEDIVIEEAGLIEASSTTDMCDLYDETDKHKEGKEKGEPEDNEEIFISGYQVAAWTRAIQRCGIASCKNPGCTFKSKDINAIIEHFKTCEHRPNINFLCKMCSFGCELKEEIQEHVKTVHMEKTDEVSEEEVGSMGSEEESEESDEIDEAELSDELLEEKKISKPKKGSPKEVTTGNKKSTRFYKNVQFLPRQGSAELHGLHSYVTSYHWTLDFQLQNHSHVPLYVDWRTHAEDWTFLDEKEAEVYLPKARTSSLFSRIEIGLDPVDPPAGGPEARNSVPWKQLSLFESFVETPKVQSNKTFQTGFITLFAGGPVWAQAWCPTSLFVNCYNTGKKEPKKKGTPVSQYMAVSCTPEFDSYHSILPPKEIEKNIIQIWDFGPLTNKENAVNKPPSMVLAIAHDFGTVWSMEWCPSGCYDEVQVVDRKEDKNETEFNSEQKKGVRPLRRLGLLAVGCSDGTVRIFSVPFPSELTPVGSDFCLPTEHDINVDNHEIKNECVTMDIEDDECTTGKYVNEVINDVENLSNQKSEPDISDKCSSTNTVGSERENDTSALKNTLTSSKSKPSHTVTLETLSNKTERSDIASLRKKKTWPVYKPSFVVTLVLENLKDSVDSRNNWQCLCLSWSLLGKSHRILAGSFSNGLVALWDLNTSSSLLKVDQTVNGVQRMFFYPYQIFLAHTNAITALTLVTCDADKTRDAGEAYPRYIVTGGRDRLLKVWDLLDTAAPISVFPRGLITSVVWLSNWISCVVSNDDGFSHGRSNSKIQSIRKYGYKPTPMLSQNSAVMTVAHSDWLNAIAHGTYGGEACILVPHQLLMAIESLKTLKSRRTMAYFTELVDFMKGEPSSEENNGTAVEEEGMDCDDNVEEIEEEKDEGEGTTKTSEKKNIRKIPLYPHVPTFAEATKRFGILFCDLPLDREAGRLPKQVAIKLQQSEKMKESPINQYPIGGINTMCWNPNLQSFIWLASGHQAGFVRICRMQKTRNKFLENLEDRAGEKIVQTFVKRKESDISAATKSKEVLRVGSKKCS